MTEFFARIQRLVTTPGRSRTVALRRALAALFVLLAVLSAARSARTHPQAVVFAHDVPAGHLLVPGDLQVVRIPATALPTQPVPVTEMAALTAGKRVITAAAQAGEVLTQARLLNPDAVSGDFLNLVPVPLAEPDIARLLHHGDVVSIVSAEKDSQSRTIATGAQVITTSLPGESTGRTKGTLLVGLPPEAARGVAAASLSLPLTIVITGARATGQN